MTGCDLMPRMERTVGRIRNHVLFDNFQSRNSAPVYETHMRGIEEDECMHFTHDIFVMIKAQILFERKFVVSHRQPFPASDSMMFYLTQYDRPGHHWSVEFISDPKTPRWMCSCKLFESDGIPCGHIFCVLKYQMVSRFPKSLVRERWTKAAGLKTMAPKLKRSPRVKSAQMGRYLALMAEVSKSCLNYSYSEEGYTSAMGEFDLYQASARFRNSEVETTPVPPQSENVVKDPRVARTKGAPPISSQQGERAKSVNAQNSERTKNTYICQNCFLPGHNKRTCTNPAREREPSGNAAPNHSGNETTYHSAPYPAENGGDLQHKQTGEFSQFPYFSDSQQSTSIGFHHASLDLKQPSSGCVDMQANLGSDSHPPNHQSTTL